MPIYLNPISGKPFQFSAQRNPFKTCGADGVWREAGSISELRELEAAFGVYAGESPPAQRSGSKTSTREPISPRRQEPLPSRAPKATKDLWSSEVLETGGPPFGRKVSGPGPKLKGRVVYDLYYRVAAACGGPAELCPAWRDRDFMEKFQGESGSQGANQADRRFAGVYNTAGVFRVGGSAVANMLRQAGVDPRHITTLALEFAQAGVLPDGTFDYNVVAGSTGGTRRLTDAEKEHNRVRFFAVTGISCPINLRSNPKRRRL